MTKEEKIIEAIEILKNERREYIVDGRERKLDWAIDMAIDALQFKDIMVNNPKTAKPTPEVCKNCKDNTQYDWIPVIEKLPSEKDGQVLVTKCSEVRIATYSEFSDTWYVGEMCAVGGEDPIAWRPLPKPYKGGDTE